MIQKSPTYVSFVYVENIKRFMKLLQCQRQGHGKVGFAIYICKIDNSKVQHILFESVISVTMIMGRAYKVKIITLIASCRPACIVLVGGHSHSKVTGMRLPMHQIKEPSVTIFLQERESLGDRSKRGGSFGMKLHKIQVILTHFFEIFATICNLFQNLMISLENFDWKSKNRGSFGIKL